MFDRVLNATLCRTCLNPLSVNPTKRSNTLKQFVDNLPIEGFRLRVESTDRYD